MDLETVKESDSSGAVEATDIDSVVVSSKIGR